MTINAPMNIGEWLFQMRRKHKFDLRTMSAQTGLDIGTISKIENGRTQATLGTIVRVGRGLGVTFSDFIQDWQGKPFSLSDTKHAIWKETIPTFQDVEALIIYVSMERQSTSRWMARALNSIATFQGEVIPLYEPQVVEKLLFGPMWQLYEVRYPPDMRSEEILDILGHNGILILNDISVYIANTGSKMPTTTEKLAALLKVSMREVSRQEIGSVERIKMIDVLLLDQELKQEGKIIAMFWNVCLFHLEMQRLQSQVSHYSGNQAVTSTEQEVRLVLMFIIICRWLQHFSKHDTSLIHDLREMLRQVNLLNPQVGSGIH